MNNTNRFLNRLLLLVVGTVLLCVGVGALLFASAPQVRAGWRPLVSDAAAAVASWLNATPLAAPLATPPAAEPSSWLWILAVVVLAAAVLLLVSFMLRQGRGRIDVIASRQGTGNGAIVVRSALAEQAVVEALSGRPELFSSHASTYAVRGIPVIKVVVTLRRGVSPRDVFSFVDGILQSLDDLLGVETPALISLSGGFRNKA